MTVRAQAGQRAVMPGCDLLPASGHPFPTPRVSFPARQTAGERLAAAPGLFISAIQRAVGRWMHTIAARELAGYESALDAGGRIRFHTLNINPSRFSVHRGLCDGRLGA